MKRKLTLLLISTTLILSACGSNASTEDTPSSETAQEAIVVESSVEGATTESDNSLSELEAIGDVKVDEGLFNVEFNIPADFVGETTQEELDAIASESGYKAITLNEDGSATYIMTKKQHKEMMEEMTVSLNESLAEMVGSEDYPNITDIKTNENFTEFAITTKSTELDLNESFSVLAFYMYGGMYNIFAGTPADNVHVEFINADSGEVISSADSSNMGE